MRTLLQMGRHQEAFDAYFKGLDDALLINLEAHPTALSLIRPFFRNGWATLPDGLRDPGASYLANSAAYSLKSIGEMSEALAAFTTSLQAELRIGRWEAVRICISNLAWTLLAQNGIAAAERCDLLALDLVDCLNSAGDLFHARLRRFERLSLMGRDKEAEEMWTLIQPMGRHWSRILYRPGMAELALARFHFWRGDLNKRQLRDAENLATTGKARQVVREIHALRGEWHLDHGRWELAAGSLHDAVRMAREVEQRDAAAECQLALANFHLGRLRAPLQEAEHLSTARDPAHGDLAALWLAIGDSEQAKKHALAAYVWAWADGEPYVRRHALNKSRLLLRKIGVAIPDLPPYDPRKHEKFSWEDDVIALIERLRNEKEKKGRTAEEKN